MAFQSKAISFALFTIPKCARDEDQQCLQISIPPSEGICLRFSA